MKILTDKQVDEILKRITACQIITNNYIEDIEALDQMTENLADISIMVGGIKGANKVINTVKRKGRWKI